MTFFAGLALIDPQNAASLRRVRSVGRVAELDARAAQEAGNGAQTGIAHTRWATHGGVTEANAHPHASAGAGLRYRSFVTASLKTMSTCGLD
jgi:glucosamine--fructose-6-phosphate aminotransferase (isomerizing)